MRVLRSSDAAASLGGGAFAWRSEDGVEASKNRQTCWTGQLSREATRGLCMVSGCPVRLLHLAGVVLPDPQRTEGRLCTTGAKPVGPVN